MTNKEIIEKAIAKAEKNGFKYGYDWKGRDEAIFYLNAWHSLIFDHEFAKAFWGDIEVYQGKTINEVYEEYQEHYTDRDDFEIGWIEDFEVEEAWTYHLKQMVLEEEPLKYLEKFL